MGKLFIVYILANRKNGTLYVGVTGKSVGRIWQHKTGRFQGFSQRYGVKRLVWYEVHENAEAAIQREKQIKERRRAWKFSLNMRPRWHWPLDPCSC